MNTRYISYLRIALGLILVAVLAASLFQPQSSASAAAVLTVTPLTWNVIGLDSNNVSVGPNHFPVGARVCNIGDTTATNVTASFVWDSFDPYIDWRPGSLPTLSVTSLAAGACTDFYFEVEVTRNSAAYNHTRRYHINATADTLGTISTPMPRELYVEHLISQNRNTVSDVQYGTTLAGLTSVANGGTMSLLVGNTYYIKLVGATATQGYEQIESFINIPNTIAINAAVSDAIPVGTTYIPSGASSGFPVPGGAPAGSTNIGVSCTDTSAVTTTTLCYYQGSTGAFPRGRIVWAGTLGPDDGATGPANADDELTIVFNLNVNAGITDVRNMAVIDSDLNGDGDITDPGEQQVATVSATWRVRSVQLPDTGFAPNVVTDLSNTARETYIQTGGITVEIPSLKINIPIVGVPLRNGEWNVAWLGKQAGWLQGSAFPSWNGNSVLTSHVYLSNGLPGPFVNLSKLKFGEKVIVHAFGQKYIFEVQTNTLVEANDASVFKHEAKPWLTLLTCKEYDERTNTYRKRVVVRAVLVDVEWE